MQKRAILLGFLLSASFSISAEKAQSNIVVSHHEIATQGMDPVVVAYHNNCYVLAGKIVDRMVRGQSLDEVLANLPAFKLHDREIIRKMALEILNNYKIEIRKLINGGTLTPEQKNEYFTFLETRYPEILRILSNPENVQRSCVARVAIRVLRDGVLAVEWADENRVTTLEGLTGTALLVAALHQVIHKNYLKAGYLGLSGLVLYAHLGYDSLPEMPRVSFNNK